jgi:hypothetical protein
MSLRVQLCRALSTAWPRAAEGGAVAMSVPFVPIGATLLDISFRAGANAAPRHVDLKKRSGQLNCSSHNLTKVGRLRYFPFSTASIITSNDNTAPYLFLIPPIVPRSGLLLASLFMQPCRSRNRCQLVGHALFPIALGGKAVLPEFSFPYPTYKSLG